MNSMLVIDIQEDLLNRQVLVLRYIECFHSIILDLLLSTSDVSLRKYIVTFSIETIRLDGIIWVTYHKAGDRHYFPKLRTCNTHA